jgi:hypothetical protein
MPLRVIERVGECDACLTHDCSEHRTLRQVWMYGYMEVWVCEECRPLLPKKEDNNDHRST